MDNSILNQKVSVFANCTNSHPIAEVSLNEWLQTDLYKSEVQIIRECKNLEKRKALKKLLPGVTSSGIFSPTRSSQNLGCHSGLLCIDIDAKNNPGITDWETLKIRLSNINNIAYCGLSVSGNGAFAIIPIAYPDEHHLGHFNAAELYFALEEGIMIDVACKDVSRLRTVSFDPNPYINHKAEPLKTYLDFRSTTSTIKIKPVDVEKVEAILDEIKGSNLDITKDYTDWFQIGCVIAKVYGEEGREKFNEFSQFHPDYNQRSCDRQFNACLKKQYAYGIGTLVFIKNKYTED